MVSYEKKKGRGSQYSTETMTHADNLAFLANT